MLVCVSVVECMMIVVVVYIVLLRILSVLLVSLVSMDVLGVCGFRKLFVNVSVMLVKVRLILVYCVCCSCLFGVNRCRLSVVKYGVVYRKIVMCDVFVSVSLKNM